MAGQTYTGGVVTESWVDTLDANGNVTGGTYSTFDLTGTQTSTRPYSSAETSWFQATQVVGPSRAANLATIYTQAKSAISTNTTFLGLTSPTNAQVVSEVQALARQNNKIIRVLLGILNSDPTALDGTN